VPGSDSFVGNGFVNHNTIFLNSLILSLLYQNSPEILRFILIDPKRVEFSAYKELPHLLCPVIFDAHKSVNVLKWLIGEMERRFEILSGNGSRDIMSYNEKIMKEKLRMIENAEEIIRNAGITQVRVRYHKNIARIEVQEKEIKKILNEKTRKRIVNELKKFGFTYITLDLQGYRSGSMDEGL